MAASPTVVLLLAPSDSAIQQISARLLAVTDVQLVALSSPEESVAHLSQSAVDLVLYVPSDDSLSDVFHQLVRAAETPVVVLLPASPGNPADYLNAGAIACLWLESPDELHLLSLLYQARALRAMRAQTRQVIETHEQQLRRIIESDQEVAFFVCSADGRVLTQNPTASLMSSLLPPVELEALLDVERASDQTREVSLTRADGKPLFVEQRMITMIWNGAPVKLITIRDVTERRHREEILSELAQRNSQFAAAIRSISTGVIITDPRQEDNPIIFINDAFMQMTGYSAEEAIGRNARFLQGMGTDPDAVALLRRKITAQESCEVTLLNYRKDGRPFWDELKIEPVFDESGQLVNFVGLQTDVTERRAAEYRLASFAERLQLLRQIDREVLTSRSPVEVSRVVVRSLRQLISAEDIVIAVLDDEDHFKVLAIEGEANDDYRIGMWLSLSMTDEYGTLQRGEALRFNDARVYAETSPFARVLVESGVVSSVVIPLMSHGQLIGVLALNSSQAFAFSEDDIRLLWEVATPLTVAFVQGQLYEQVKDYTLHLEGRVAERTAELERSEARALTILNNASDGLVLVNAEGMIELANPAFDALFGFAPNAAEEHLLTELTQPVYVSELSRVLQQAASGAGQQSIEVVMCRADGIPFTADIALAPLVSGPGEEAQVICSLRDVTTRKQIEENLREALHRERELSELKSRFTSMVSHEFRTPLATILSSSDIIKRYFDRMPEERRVEHLNTIQSQVTSLTDMLDDILTLSRAETIGLSFAPEPFDLVQFCRAVVAEIEGAVRIPHTVRFTASDCAEAVMDKKLIRQVLLNLLSNAAKYSPPNSEIEFELRCDDHEALITIRDHGIGIPEEDQKHLFDAFHRSENVGSVPGTGLGLTIARHAVDLHKGGITFESTVGVGTAFTVRLPLFPPDGLPQPARPETDVML